MGSFRSYAVFLVLVLSVSRHTRCCALQTIGWQVTIPINCRLKEPIKLQTKVQACDDDSREPAGASFLLFSRRRRLRLPFKSASGQPDKNAASPIRRFWQHKIRQKRRRPQQTQDLSEPASLENDEAPSTRTRVVDVLDIEDWACVNDQERQHLVVMKKLLQQDLARIQDCSVEVNGKNARVMEAFPDVYGDLRLLRYLRKDAVPNPESAAARYRKFLQWRIDNNVDSAVRSQVEKRPFSPPSNLTILKELMPCEFDVNQGGTSDTIPILLYVGAWDTHAVTSLIQRDEMTLSSFLLYWTHMFESLNLKLHQEMLERKRMVYIDEIADLHGLSMGHLSPSFVRLVLRPFIKVSQSNYPETTKRIIFLSPPKIVSIVWNIVAPMASPGTVAKVQFKGDYQGSCMDFVLDEMNHRRYEA